MKKSQPNLHRAKKLRKPFQIFWSLVLFALLAAPFTTQFKFLSFLEDAALSLRFAVRGVMVPGPDDPRIVIVGVDDRSLEADFTPEDLEAAPWLSQFQEGWPWPRSLHGELLRRILADGARTVSFDFVFPGTGRGDEGFREALAEAGDRAVLGMDFIPEETAIGEVFFRERWPSESVLPPESASLVGFTNIIPDDDGVVRRVVLQTNIAFERIAFTEDPEKRARLRLLSERVADFPALSLATAESYRPDFRPPSDASTGASYLINYAGPSGWFPTLSATDFFLPGRRDRAAEIVKDAAVIVAPWSDFFKDDRPTPFETVFGAEIHAHALRNLLLGNFLHAPTDGTRALWLAALSLLSALAVAVPRGVAAKSGLLATTVVLWIIGCQMAFGLAGLVLPVAAGCLLLLGTGGGLLLYDYLLEQMERRQVKRYLSHYVSPSVARILLEEGGGFERLRKGEVRPVSLLFSDIRGFTSASENRDPGELTAQLNEYFDQMVGPIFDTDGSLNKYIGDAVFAVWGDLYPRGTKTDAENCLKAAVRMRRALARLNRQWEHRPDRIPLRIGIGLHQGDAFVGNVGHPARLEVAVMGDAVNLAARIESANKFYGTDILASETFVREAGAPTGMIEVDRVLLSGSTRPMDLFSPVDGWEAETATEPDWVEPWNSAVAAYREGRFESALETFQSLASAPEKIRELYLGRCRNNLHTPASDCWSPVQKLEK